MALFCDKYGYKSIKRIPQGTWYMGNYYMVIRDYNSGDGIENTDRHIAMLRVSYDRDAKHCQFIKDTHIVESKYTPSVHPGDVVHFTIDSDKEYDLVNELDLDVEFRNILELTNSSVILAINKINFVKDMMGELLTNDRIKKIGLLKRIDTNLDELNLIKDVLSICGQSLDYMRKTMFLDKESQLFEKIDALIKPLSKNAFDLKSLDANSIMSVKTSNFLDDNGMVDKNSYLTAIDKIDEDNCFVKNVNAIYQYTQNLQSVDNINKLSSVSKDIDENN